MDNARYDQICPGNWLAPYKKPPPVIIMDYLFFPIFLMILHIELEKWVDNITQQCWLLVKPTIKPLADPMSASLSLAMQQDPPSRSSCAEILIQRCPACFGGTSFGKPLDQGGDIHVATDGNFHHRHRCSVSNSPSFYEPSYFIPKAQVDTVGWHIDHACQHPTKWLQSTVPDETIDQCEASYEAVDGQKQKMAMDNFDDTGLMALICWHDIPVMDQFSFSYLISD